jgi:hypothetical protein
MGEPEAAVSEQDIAIDLAERIGALGLLCMARAHRLACLLDSTRPENLSSIIREAERLRSEGGNYASIRCVSQALLARAHLAQNDRESALRASESAMADLERLGTLDEFEEYVRLTHVRVLQVHQRDLDADRAIYQARERLTRKAAKLQTPSLRRSFAEQVATNRALLDLARMRLGSKG